jgi:acyl carrier protein
MTDTTQRLLKIFNEISNTDAEINLETNIDALDLDSLETMDLLMMIENEFKKEIAIDKFSSCQNIGAVSKILEAS